MKSKKIALQLPHWCPDDMERIYKEIINFYICYCKENKINLSKNYPEFIKDHNYILVNRLTHDGYEIIGVSAEYCKQHDIEIYDACSFLQRNWCHIGYYVSDKHSNFFGKIVKSELYNQYLLYYVKNGDIIIPFFPIDLKRIGSLNYYNKE